MTSRERVIGGYLIRTPRWADWQAALAKGAGKPATALQHLLVLCAGITSPEVAALRTATADELLSALLALMEEELAALALVRVDHPDGAVALTGGGLALTLKPWSFGERQRALVRSLRLVNGALQLDMPSFEQAMLIACVRMGETTGGRCLTPEEIAAWPALLGESVLRILDEVNGLAPEAELAMAECVRRGLRHPDLEMAQLCFTFGWTPEQVESLGARQVERLLAGLRAMGVAQSAQAAPAGEGAGEVTRIVVGDG